MQPSSPSVEQKSVHTIWYASASVLIGLSWLANKVALYWPSPYLLLLGAICLAIGFLLWSRPAVRQIAASDSGKVAIALLHAVAILVATVFSRSLVASALQLPPQDFDLTVYTFAVAIYLPALAIVSAAIFMAIAVVMLFAGSFLAAFGKNVQVLFLHGFGALIISAILLYAVDNMSFPAHATTELVKRIAYHMDYFEIPLYPEAGHDRIRLHENGVISVATPTDDGIAITVRQYKNGT